jgi:hypothetical protein
MNRNAQIMDIKGQITGIKYNVFLQEELQIIDIDRFNVNKVVPFCILKDGKYFFAVSKWVSPKRTRSYPYERVYNTLNVSKKITIIPIIKDEGFDGDRDFLQWDTISLMSLLDVFVIFAYYDKAVKNSNYDNKITDFQFDNEYVVSKIKEIEQYHSSALHWNLNELKNNLHNIVGIAQKCYEQIKKQTGVALHNPAGLDRFKTKIGKDVSRFMEFSREKAEQAQSRVIVTTQPQESLSTLSKASITITNYLGGQYFFTVDEVAIIGNTVYLIEGKHSKSSILPNKGDIKDGLLKMILYSNLCEVTVNDVAQQSKAVLNLTSSKIVGEISSDSSICSRKDFVLKNNFAPAQTILIDTLFKEAEENNFTVKIGYAR